MTIPRSHGRLLAAILLATALAGCAGQRDQAGAAPGGPGTPPASGAADGSPAVETPRSRLPHDTSGTPTAGCREGRPMPSSYQTQGMDVYPANGPLLDALDRISAAGNSRFQKSFAGVQIVEDRGEGAVHRVPDAAFDTFIMKEAGADICLYLRDARFSAATLTAFGDRISADFAYWRKRGINVNSVGGKGQGSGITVGVAAEDIDEARVELPKRYGTRIPITIEEQGPIRAL
ncbi:hypothetical protein [Catellatospora sichuanensis]|uniref:hypothetical protein n=1 Tax=Catellatospora sichuanensis TaxID=1969805 RepID=UPI001183D28E|nr:hypothetical protein [Catellatospora sichuanensis]